MVKFSEGDKVRLIEHNPWYGLGKVRVGDIGTVRIADAREVLVDFPAQKSWHGLESDFELVKPKKKHDMNAENLENILRRLERIERILDAKIEAGAIKIPKSQKTPAYRKRRRKEAIDFAKAYVKGTTEELRIISDVEVLFIIDKERGIVTASLTLGRYGKLSEVRNVGIAQVSKGEVFNEYIGRAIALMRAIDEDVPDILYMAPQPTEPLPGMIVDSNSFYGVMTLAEEARLSDKILAVSTYRRLTETKILDDTGVSY